MIHDVFGEKHGSQKYRSAKGSNATAATERKWKSLKNHGFYRLFEGKQFVDRKTLCTARFGNLRLPFAVRLPMFRAP